MARVVDEKKKLSTKASLKLGYKALWLSAGITCTATQYIILHINAAVKILRISSVLEYLIIPV